MKVSVDVEDSSWQALPELEALTREAVVAALSEELPQQIPVEVALLFTGDAAIAEINSEWRGQNKPTNVLSFPAPEDMPLPEGENRPLGDIVLAFGVISREAREQGKSLRDHTAHLIVHGVLHLLGYDHETDAEAEDMEHREVQILKGMGISDPYERH